MLLDLSERSLADIVFDPAGIFCRRFFVNTQFDQRFRKNTVTLVDAFCCFGTFFSKEDLTVFGENDQFFVFQYAHGTAYAWLGKIHLARDIDGMHISLAFLNDQDRFQIVFARFIKSVHKSSPLYVVPSNAIDKCDNTMIIPYVDRMEIVSASGASLQMTKSETRLAPAVESSL